MKDKMKGGYAAVKAMTSLMLTVAFLLASGANAQMPNMLTVWPGESITDVINNASPGDIVEVESGTYYENIEVNQPVILKGLGNPTLSNASPGANIIDVKTAGVTITGFTITGTSAAGILVNGSPDIIDIMGKPLVIYNNIYGNDIGLQNDLTEENADASMNFWGTNGNGAEKGKPGAATGTHANNDVEPESGVNYDPWLTAEIVNSDITDASMQPDCDLTNMLFLDNTGAGVDVTLTGGLVRIDYPITTLASALYNDSPYGSSIVPGTAVKFVDVYVRNYQGGTGAVALVNISYADVDISGVIEGTLTPYVLVGSSWRAANSVEVDDVEKVVRGTIPVSWLAGSPIALVGKDYQVTIAPPQDTSTPIQDKPEFTMFTIESVDEINAVYYQLDGHGSTGWTPIETGYSDTIWKGAPWSVSDAVWDNVTDGSHTFYFKFDTISGEVGNSGEISWQFVKGGEVPPEDLVKIISPKPGQKLSRTPVQIKWTLPSEENIDSIDIWFDRYGDFNMNGGLNNPLHLATLGGGTTFSWRSPNIQTDTAKILVVVTYMDGTEYYGISENFSIVKGYSFKAYKKAPKPVYNIGSGISQGVATIGAWFHKPRLPFLV